MTRIQKDQKMKKNIEHWRKRAVKKFKLKSQVSLSSDSSRSISRSPKALSRSTVILTFDIINSCRPVCETQSDKVWSLRVSFTSLASWYWSKTQIDPHKSLKEDLIKIFNRKTNLNRVVISCLPFWSRIVPSNGPSSIITLTNLTYNFRFISDTGEWFALLNLIYFFFFKTLKRFYHLRIVQCCREFI